MVLRRIAPFAAAWCAFAVTASGAGVSERFAVDIRLRVDRSIAARSITDNLKAETEAIWGLYGIRIAWSDTNASDSPANSVSLDVSVERQPRYKQMESAAVLGHVVMRPRVPTWRPIHVSVDATERVLAERTTERPSSGILLDRELARALGRVLAHEIGHVLLDASFHDRAGLMRPAFRGESLADPDRRPFRLTCSAVDRLRRRLRELTDDTDAAVRHDSATLNLPGLRATISESPAEVSCINSQPLR